MSLNTSVTDEIIISSDSETENDEDQWIYYYNKNKGWIVIDKERFSWRYCFVRVHRGINIREMAQCKKCPKSAKEFKNVKVDNHSNIEDKLLILKEFVNDDAPPVIKKIKKNKSNNYECEKCNKTFNSYQSLQEHKSKPDHIEHPPFTCSKCDKTFTYLSNLYLHFEIHKYEYKCSECEKSFNSSEKLQKHAITHDKPLVSIDKPFVCQICNKRFRLFRFLKKHLHVHNPRHKCNKCDMVFNFKINLEKHERKHDKEVKCYECGKVFDNLVDFNKHYSIHFDDNDVLEELKPDKPNDVKEVYLCGDCDESFEEKSLLIKHAENH